MAEYVITNFTGGEVSPKLYGRIELPQLRNGAKELSNFFVLPQGGIRKRPGTVYCGTTKSSGVARLVLFMVDKTTPRVLEFGNLYMRVYKDGEVVETGGAAYELTTTYTSAHVKDLRYVQIGDVLYIVHPSYPPRKLTYTSDTSWAIADCSFSYGANPLGITFGSAGNYPGLIGVYESRLILAATDNKPGTFWGSVPGLPEDFTNTSTPTASEAWEKTPQAAERNVILWLCAAEALLFGTTSGPWRAGGKESVLSPSTAWWPNRQGAVGSDPVPALMVDDSVLFVEKGGKRIRQFAYSEPADKYLAADITFFSGHITGGGVKELAFQQEPEPILWARLSDGTFACMSYSRQAQVAAWSPADVGGEVESVLVAPTDDEDEVYMIVKRTIDGGTVRYVEKVSAWELEDIRASHFVDCGAVIDNGDPVEVTSVTNADPPVVTAAGHGFSNGDFVRFTGVEDINHVNGVVFKVANQATNTFELYYRDGSTSVDLSGEASAGSGGTVEKVQGAVDGLDHLDGEVVAMLGDGGEQEGKTVTDGEITLDDYANTIHVGLPFTAKLVTADMVEAHSRKKRIVSLFLRLYQTVGGKIGQSENTLEELPAGEPPFELGVDPVLYSGTRDQEIGGVFGCGGNIWFYHEEPLPCTLLSMTARVEAGA